jgi:hypothetical protein
MQLVIMARKSCSERTRKVAWKALNNIDPKRNIQFVLGLVDELWRRAGL